MDTPDPVTAELFMKYDYAETKDLLKTFITLISATLVVSITFSEKIVGIRDTSSRVRETLIWSWSLLVAALICAGVALAFIAAAAGKVIYERIPIFDWHYGFLALISWSFVLLAGGAFIAALITMIIAGARSAGGGNAAAGANAQGQHDLMSVSKSPPEGKPEATSL
ncbi:hypothetical protein [Bradyrhizobium sp. YR681]|uniref:hypothetical protein n=1 Tax=Bradyrhizobium sp. YR681 TaxID=1144344 RepID=UPI00055CEF76|nr:hypothetical protein [Bradyrhizobium sp. YR681]